VQDEVSAERSGGVRRQRGPDRHQERLQRGRGFAVEKASQSARDTVESTLGRRDDQVVLLAKYLYTVPAATPESAMISAIEVAWNPWPEKCSVVAAMMPSRRSDRSSSLSLAITNSSSVDRPRRPLGRRQQIDPDTSVDGAVP
jgi:hypothetical protein